MSSGVGIRLVLKKQLPILLDIFLIAIMVGVIFWHVLSLGFVGDDWIFYNFAGRLNLTDYLIKYWDPRVQTTWYRPVQGMIIGLESLLFGSNFSAYHVVHVLLHLANCLLIYSITRGTRLGRQTALVAALIFATLPTAAFAVVWIGVVDVLETFLYLFAIRLWFLYRQTGRKWTLAFVVVTFGLALLTKEIGIFLPITLFLIDRYWIKKPTDPREFIFRYSGFVLIGVVYALIMYVVLPRSLFISREGYGFNNVLFSNTIEYLSMLAFPWSYFGSGNYILLVIVAAFLLHRVVVEQKTAALAITPSAILLVLVVAPFPMVVTRFLYLPLATSAVGFGVAFNSLWSKLPQKIIFKTLALGALILMLLDGGMRVGLVADDFKDWQNREQAIFHQILENSSPLDADTYIYFVNPPLPGPVLSGMYLGMYGRNVFIQASDSDQLPQWHLHKNNLLILFDESGTQTNQQITHE